MHDTAWADLLDGIGGRLSGDPAGKHFLPGLTALRHLVPAEVSPVSAKLPVQRQWPAAGAGDPLGPLMAAVERHISAAWQQNSNYRAAPPRAGFLENYGYLECAGPGAPFLCADFRLGLLLLGPHTLYPPHHHPAEEIYLPLGPGLWWRDGEAWGRREAGAVIHHPPMCAHATKSGDEALAAIYLWRGEIEQAAVIS